MTLLLTALTPNHVVQVSDRRLTWPDGSFKDGFVKAVVTPRFACTYTGLAGDTAKWIARRLASHFGEEDGGFDALARDLALACRSMGFVGRPLAVVSCGWIVRDSAPFPVVRVISNFDPHAAVIDVQRAFGFVNFETQPDRLSSVIPLGQSVYPNELSRVVRNVEGLCRSGRDSARAIAQVLTEAVRGVARSSALPHDRREPTVSEDVLVVSLPRPDRLSGPMVVGKLVDDWWSVTSIPAGESRAERHGGPIVVGDHAAIRPLEAHERPPGADGEFNGLELVVRPRDGGGVSAAFLTDPPLGAAWGWPGLPAYTQWTGRPPPEEASPDVSEADPTTEQSDRSVLRA